MGRRWVGLVVVGGLALLLAGCGGLFRSGVEDGPGPGYGLSPSPTGDYLVVCEQKAIPASARDGIVALGGEIKDEWPAIGVLLVWSDDPDFPKQAAEVPGVKGIGHDLEVGLPEVPFGPIIVANANPPSVAPMLDGDIAANDLYVQYQWDIRRVGGDADTWAIEQGAGAVVAVLDTGVDYTHPDIEPNYLYGKSYVPGWDEDDYHGHGTHVAGSIAAPLTEGRIIGIAPRAGIANYKVLGPEGGMVSWIVAAIQDAADDGCHVINMSLGGYRNLTDPDGLAAFMAYARATQYAWDQGTLVVSAAGNAAWDFSRGPFYSLPTMAPASLSITATGPTDLLANYSDYGAYNADFAGPGGDLSDEPHSMCLSAYTRHAVSGPPGEPVYGFAVGTSMAAPKVAGVAALIYAANPGISPTQVVRILERTAEDLGPAGYDFQFGWGLAHAYRALTR